MSEYGTKFPACIHACLDCPRACNECNKACIECRAVMELHLIYFKGEDRGGDVFYVRQESGEESFSKPIQVNSQPGSAIAAGTIRGARLAVGKNGRVHVVWSGGKGAVRPMRQATHHPKRAKQMAFPCGAWLLRFPNPTGILSLSIEHVDYVNPQGFRTCLVADSRVSSPWLGFSQHGGDSSAKPHNGPLSTGSTGKQSSLPG